MRSDRFLVVKGGLVVLLLLFPFASSTTNNDAGSGADAGDTPGAALLLAQEGTYSGDRASSSDADWYRLDTSLTGPVCVEASTSGDAHALVNLTTEGVVGPQSTAARLSPSGTASVAIATLDISKVLLGLSPPPTGGQGDGAYNFTLNARAASELGTVDADTGLDAGATLEDAVSVTGSCFRGKLDPDLEVADTKDVYALDGHAGDRLSYSIAHGGSALVKAKLISPSGATGPVVESGEIAHVLLDEDGTYYLEVSQASGLETLYMASVTTGPDPGSSCQPTCVSL